MNVNGELKNAALEAINTTDTNNNLKKPNGQIRYNIHDKSLTIGNNTANATRLFTFDVNTIQQFRSAMFPVGSLLYSALSRQEFLNEMGSSWSVVSDRYLFPLAQSHSDSVLIKPDTDFGALLLARGVVTEQHNWGNGNVASPVYSKIDGLYLRVAGDFSIGGSNYNYHPEERLHSQNMRHNHTETFTDSGPDNNGSGANETHKRRSGDPNYQPDGNYAIGRRSGRMEAYTPMVSGYGWNPNDSYTKTYTIGNYVYNGYDQTQVESRAMNLFLKLNRI